MYIYSNGRDQEWIFFFFWKVQNFVHVCPTSQQQTGQRMYLSHR